MLGQASSALNIGSCVIDAQLGALRRELQGSPHALIGLCQRDIPILVQDHHLTVLADHSDEMHFANRERQFGRWSKAGRQITNWINRMHLLG